MRNRTVVTIGFFDGVHIGHRKLIKRLIDESKKSSCSSIVMTFDRPTQNVCGLLTPLDEKLKLLENFEITQVDVLKFDQRFADISPEDFFYKILIKKYNISKIIVGYDFVFGRDRTGNIKLLNEFCQRTNTQLTVVKPQIVSIGQRKTVVSSSFIRNSILGGRIKLANELLAANYSIEGKIVKGNRIGRLLGFPTVNLKIDKNKLLPKGVFAGYVIIQEIPYSALLYIGTRPTLSDSDSISCEIHIVGFRGRIEGLRLKFYFLDKVRNEIKFDNIQQLRNQINGDASNILISTGGKNKNATQSKICF